MTVPYSITEQDYVRAMQFHARIPKMLTHALAVCLALLVILGFLSQDMRYSYMAFGGVIGALIFIGLIRFVLVPFLGHRDYRRYKLIKDHHEIGVEDDGLVFVSSNGHAKLGWDKFYKWKENDQFFLIYPMPRLYYIIPKSVGEQGIPLDVIRAKLLEFVGKSTA